MISTSTRLFLVAIAGLLFVAACSSSAGSTSSTTATSAAVVAPTEATATTIDTRTDEEKAIDRLDLMMFDLGVTDLETTANCVIARMESEGIEVTGESTSELIALFGCDENVLARWLPSTNPALPAEAWSCTVESIGEWIDELTIPDAAAFFEAVEPPAEFIELTATRCSVDAEDLVAAL